MVRDAIRVLTEPSLDQVLEFCGRAPVERVFLEDVARRGLGRFVAAADPGGRVTALCHVGANIVPSGEGCERFADAAADSRSRMNVTFRLPSEELEKTFVKESTAAGFDGLKGHRSVGGLRASIYNAFPEAGVEALVQFMQEFERKNG